MLLKLLIISMFFYVGYGERTCGQPKSGYDITGGHMVGLLGEESDCCAYCQLTRRCKGWTTQQHGYTFSHGCWLRNDTTGIIANPTVSYGVLFEDNSEFCNPACDSYNTMNIAGNDIGVVAGRLTDCCRLCKAQSGCVAWTHSILDGCHLKSSISTPTTNLLVNSGILGDGIDRPYCGAVIYNHNSNGNNLATRQLTQNSYLAKKFSDCCDFCSQTIGCVAWVVNGNTCYLKSDIGSVVPASEYYIAAMEQTPPSTCNNIYYNVDIPGNDIVLPVSGEIGWPGQLGDCCAYCEATCGCVAWTWSNGKCYLKYAISPPVATSGVHYGFVESAVYNYDITKTCGAVVQNMHMADGTFEAIRGNSTDDCCKYCQEVYECQVWVFHEGICFLKNTQSAAQAFPGASYGVVTKTSNTFVNPILSRNAEVPFYGSDPWVYYHPQDGYYYYTDSLLDRIDVRRTTEMSKLRNVPNVTIWSTQQLAADGLKWSWGPEIHWIQGAYDGQGAWYVYFSAQPNTVENQVLARRMYVIENNSTDPFTGTWGFKGELTNPLNNYTSDGTIFEYPPSSNNWYMLWSGLQPGSLPFINNIYMAPLGGPWWLAPGVNPIIVSTPTYDWEKSRQAVNEGPQAIINPNGRLLVVFTGSYFETDEYALGVVSLDGTNPMNQTAWWKKPVPIFYKSLANHVYGPGHNGFFKSKDGTEDWVVYHAKNLSVANPPPCCAQNVFCDPICDPTLRSPRMQKFTWCPNGFPEFGVPVALNVPVAVPSGET